MRYDETLRLTKLGIDQACRIKDQRIAELETQVAELKSTCARCDSRTLAEGTMWCASCLEWYREEYKPGATYDKLEDEITALRAQVAGLTADKERELMLAFVDGAKWWEWKTNGATMWQSDQNDAAEAWKEKRKRLDAARKQAG